MVGEPAYQMKVLSESEADDEPRPEVMSFTGSQRFLSDRYIRVPSTKPWLSDGRAKTAEVIDEITGPDTVQRAFLPRPEPIVPTPRAPRPADIFQSLQEWEGHVIERLEDSFRAHLTDLFGNEPEEQAEISLEEIAAEDLKYVTLGAIFYWNIGYLTKATGTRMNVSVIRFRRLPAWTEKELKKLDDEVSELHDFLKQ